MSLPIQTNEGNRGVWFWCACLIVLVVLATNIPLFNSNVGLQWDAGDFFAPSFSLVADHIKAHRLVMWDPWVSAGVPEFAEPEFGTTSPILLLIALLFPGPLAGFIAYWMLLWILAGIGMLLFARHLKCPPWGATVAALGYLASGFFVAHSQDASWICSGAFLPWICWRFDDALLRRRAWSAVQAGVFYGLAGLAGHPQFTILTPGFLMFWAVGRIFFADEEPPTLAPTPRGKQVAWAAAALLLMILIGGLILSPPYLGMTAGTRGYSDRIGERPRHESLHDSVLPVTAVATLASPYLILLDYPTLRHRLFAISDIAMSDIYSGAVVMVLALLALFGRSRWRYWLVAVALFFLCCAFGYQTPLRGWLYDFVPPTRYFRTATSFSLYTILVLCVLAAQAARDIAEGDEHRRSLRGIFVPISIAVALTANCVFILALRQVGSPPFLANLAITHVVLAWWGIVAVALLFYSRKISARGCAKLLLALGVLDAVLAILIAAPVMYNPWSASWWKIVSRNYNPALNLTAHGLERVLATPNEATRIGEKNNQNVPMKIAAFASVNTLHNRFALAMEQDPLLRQFALGKDRAWFSEQATDVPVSNGAYAALERSEHALNHPIIVVHSPAEMASLRAGLNEAAASPSENLEQAQPALPAAVEVISYRPNTLELRYTAPAAGWLMITDRWAPGWRAEVNGKTAEVYGADFIFRAVKVDAGANTILFRYRPPTFLPSLIVSWGTLLVILILEVIRWQRRRASLDTVVPA